MTRSEASALCEREGGREREREKESEREREREYASMDRSKDIELGARAALDTSV